MSEQNDDDRLPENVKEGRQLINQFAYATDLERYTILMRNKTIEDQMTKSVQSLILFPEYVEPSTGYPMMEGLRSIARLQSELNRTSPTMRVGAKIWIDPETRIKHRFDIHLKEDEDIQQLVDRDNSMVDGWTRKRDRDGALLNKGRRIREEDEREAIDKMIKSIQGRREPPMQRRRRGIRPSS